MYQEMATLVATNNYLVPGGVRRSYAMQNRYVIVVTDLEEELGEESNVVVEKLETLKKNAYVQFDQVSQEVSEIKQSYNRINKA